MRRFPAAWSCVVAFLLLLQPSLSQAFQRMGVLAPQTVTLPPAGQANLSARCLDETASPPLTTEHFTRVLHGDAPSATVSRRGQTTSFSTALREGWITVSGELTEQQGAAFVRELRSGRYSEAELARRSYQLYDAVVVQNETSDTLSIWVIAPIVLGGTSHSPYAFNPIPLISENQTAGHSRVSEAQTRADAAEAKRREDEARRVREEAQRTSRESARRVLPPLFEALDPAIAADHRLALDAESSAASWRETSRGKLLLKQLDLLKRQAVGLGVSTNSVDTESAGFFDELRKVSAGERVDLDAVERRFEADIRRVQITLNFSGFEVAVDGDFGAATAAALRRFQASHELPTTGVVDAVTHERLDRAYQSATEYLSFFSTASGYQADTEIVSRVVV
jgi:hypothetical protein